MSGLHTSRTAGLVAATCALVWCMALPAQAEIYRWVDANGTVHFSDEPRPGAQSVQLAPISTISLPQPDQEAQESLPEAEEEPVAFRYQQFRISYPEPNSAFHSPNGTFTVTTEIEPPLLPSHELRLLLDGRVYAQGGSGQFLLENIDRGTHQLEIQALENDSLVQSSGPLTFTVHRPSLLHPNRPKLTR